MATDNAFHVLVAVNCPTEVVLDGFIVSDGNADLLATHSIFYGAYEITNDVSAGLSIENSKIKIYNCQFENNTGLRGAGGIQVSNSELEVHFSSFINNRNTGGRGGAILVTDTDLIVSNCIFDNNYSRSWGAGIDAFVSNISVINSTFTNNMALQGAAGITIGSWSFAPITAEVSNCLFWGNSTPYGEGNADLESYEPTTVNNCLLQHDISNYGPTIYGDYYILNDNVYNTDPHFVNILDADGVDNLLGTADDGLALKNCSPAINSGLNSSVIVSKDFQGESRIQHTQVDIGAYENSLLAVNLTKSTSGLQCYATSIVFTATATTSGGTPNFDFRVNGQSVQNSTSNVFTTTTLKNDDLVYVYLDSSSCELSGKSISYEMEIVNLPELTNDSPKCIGQTVNFTSTEGSAYNWAGPNGFTSNLQNPGLQINSTNQEGIYTATVTIDGCSLVNTTNVTLLNDFESPTITNSIAIVCAPDSLLFNGTCTSGDVVWFNGFIGNQLTLKNTGSYVVTAVCTVSECSSDPSTPIVAEIKALPVLSVSSNSPVCTYETIHLLATGTGTFSWTGPNTSSNLQNPSFTNVSSAYSGRYFVTLTNNGCSAIDSLDVVVIESPVSPVITSPNNLTICSSDSLTFHASCPTGSVTWFDNSNLDSLVLKTVGTYNVTATCSANGCTSSPNTPIAAEITQIPPKPIIQVLSDLSVCSPDSIIFKSSCTTGQLIWSDNSTLDSLILKVPDSYVISAHCTLNGCLSELSDEINAQVFAKPTSPTVTAPSFLSICSPDSLIFKATCTSGTPRWYNGIQADSIVLTEVGTYTVSAICAENACESEAAFSISAEIKANPTINLSSNSPVCYGDTLKLFSTSDTGQSFQWSGPNSNTSQDFYIANAATADSGRYFVNVQGDNGCYNTDSIDIVVKTNGRLYVDASASGANNGSSWTDAFTSLQAALDVQCYGEIWVAGGTYFPSQTVDGYTSGNPRVFTFKLRTGKKLYGSFEGTETDLSQRTKAVIKANPSILSGDLGTLNDPADNAYNVVLISNDDANGRLDGFTITAGNGDVYGFHHVNNRFLYFNNGSGINIDSSATTIANCIIQSNTVANNGGGVHMTNHCDIAFIDCVIDSNVSATYGGGILALAGSKITMDRSVISNNTSQFGAGLLSLQGAVTMRNSLIYNNIASWHAGGVRIISGKANASLIENNTFVKNVSTYGGSAIEIQQTDSIRIVNTIFHQNTKSSNANSFADDVMFDVSGRKLFVVNSLLQHEISEGKYPQNGGLSGFQFTDTYYKLSPLFKDIDHIDGADGILQTSDDGLIPENCSPAINSGTNAISTSTDFKNENRTGQSQTDIGAYETNFVIQPISVSLTSNYSGPICEGTELIFSATALNAGPGIQYNFLVNGYSVQNSSVDTLAISTLNSNDSVSVYITYGICDAMSNYIKVQVNSSPVNTAIDHFTICQGQPLSFTANGGDSYVWMGPNGFAATYSGKDSTITFLNAQPGLAGTYYVTISTGFCSIYDSVEVYIQNPTVTLSSSASGQICPGTLVTFQANIADNFIANPYAVFAVNGGSKQAGTNLNYSTNDLADGDIVSVAVSDACIIYSNQITMDVADFTGVSTPLLSSFCGGDSLKLYVNGGESYQWTGPNGFSSTEQNPKVANATAAMSGTYTVVVSIGSCSTTLFTVASVSANPFKSKIFVDSSAAGNNNGSSWADAFTDFQAALDYGCFDTIWVAGGTYHPSKNLNGNISAVVARQRTFHLPSGKVIMGGFAGTEIMESQRDTAVISQNPSILSGDQGVPGDASDNSYHVVMAALESSATVLDGFTIQDGNANGTSNDSLGSVYVKQSYGGGLISAYSAAQIRNITFKNNKAKYGAGFFNQVGTETIDNCVFRNNVADSTGGGLFNLQSNPTITNSQFIQNSAAAFGGGGMANSASSPSIEKCLFKLNSGRQGGGIGNAQGSSPTVKNSFFIQNSASYAGGGFGSDGTSGGAAPLPKLINCVFANNTSSQFGGAVANNYAFPAISYCSFYGNSSNVYGGGIFNANASISTISNTIFYANAAVFGGGDIYNFAGGSSSILNAILQFNAPGSNLQVGVNPLFAEPATPAGADGIFWTADDGLRLQTSSPAIDFGAVNTLTSTDILGNQRVFGSLPDLGPYEFALSVQDPTDITVDNTTVCINRPFTLSASCEAAYSPVWYEDILGGTSIYTGSPYMSSRASNTTFYVACEFGAAKSARVEAAIITVNPNPPAPSADAIQNYCTGATIAELQATGSNLEWSENKVVKQPTDLLISSPNYRVTQTVSGCTSLYAFVEVVLTTAPVPAISASPMQIGAGASSLLTSSACTGTVTWSPGGATGTSLIVSPTITTIYNATCTVNGCESESSETVEVTVSGISPCASLVQLQTVTDDISSGITLISASALTGKIQASNKIQGTANVSFEARSIELNTGFEANGGTVFRAETGGCN